MRARLALTAAAVTTMIVMAFCLPLGRLIQVVAANRALEAAKLESRSLAGAISAVPGQTATITQLVEQANAGSPRPITVYLPTGTILGEKVPADAEVELARKAARSPPPPRTAVATSSSAPSDPSPRPWSESGSTAICCAAASNGPGPSSPPSACSSSP